MFLSPCHWLQMPLLWESNWKGIDLFSMAWRKFEASETNVWMNITKLPKNNNIAYYRRRWLNKDYWSENKSSIWREDTALLIFVHRTFKLQLSNSITEFIVHWFYQIFCANHLIFNQKLHPYSAVLKLYELSVHMLFFL